ncbi:type VII secretion target [Aldersonia kunmingensis]|uniref:type VII secretion target n=1 Tax=Aldersonia kunmingensis TaxID=408066 RepID=UPI00082CA41E|nr:type VII secretion target [Aldersonia kunmingensis]
MSSVEVVPAGIRAYADTNQAIAAQLASAAGFDAAENVAAATPVFGLIGADFLAMFALAQANHAQTVGKLSATFNASSTAAQTNAASYENTDNQHGASLDSIAGGLA